MTSSESIYERYAATLKGAIELAAAESTAEVARLMHRMANASRRTQREVAKLLEVSDGRVSQVLNGDRNVTIADLAKYSRAFGYRVSISVVPVESDVSAVDASPRRKRRDSRVGSGRRDERRGEVVVERRVPLREIRQRSYVISIDADRLRMGEWHNMSVDR